MLGLTADMDMDGDFADETLPQKSHKPAKAPAVKEVSAEDQPLSEDERQMLIGLIQR